MQGAPTEEGGTTIGAFGGPGSDGSSPGSTVFVDASEVDLDCLLPDEWQDDAMWEDSLGLEATIEDEKSEKTPFVGDKELLHVLAAGDQLGEPIELERIMMLGKHCAYLRRTKADGNCFFRSFMFSYLEHVLETLHRAEVDRVQLNIDKYKTLQDLGCPGFAIEVFCQERAEAGYIKTNTDQSRKTPLDPGQSDFILIYDPQMQERQEADCSEMNTDQSRKTPLDLWQSDFILVDVSQDHVPEMQERQELDHIKKNTDKSRKTLLDPGQSDFVLADYSQR